MQARGCDSAVQWEGNAMTHIATIYIALTISTEINSLALSAIPRFAPEESGRYYTVQIMATPAENPQTLLAVYRSLRDKGHLVYYYPKHVGDRQYLRLRAGIFESPARAKAYAEELKRQEGLDFFIAQADVAVARFKDQFSIVTTPSGIWLAAGASARELYVPIRGRIDMERTTPQIAPDGTAIVFWADSRIMTVTLNTGEARILRQAASDDELLNSVVRWSPDGRYITYLDTTEWELPARLWIMRADGTENRCLVGDTTGKTKVKSFQWHPREDRVFYVVGPTHGTVSLGGSLCTIDLGGRNRTIVEANSAERMEVLSEFRIADGRLQYRTVHHNADGGEPQYSLHERALNELD